MRNTAVLLGAVMIFLGASSTHAAKIGDAAAPLVIKEWVKGGPADVTDGKNVYVVEFWATWCPPCRKSIPHLTDLQKQFKDKAVVVIGISDETPDKVKPFLKEQGDKMDYTVAVDDERKSSKAYMEAFGQAGIPHAFIVGKDGKVIWHGHPMDGLDKALEEIVAGKYDLNATVRKDEIRAATDAYRKLSQEDEAKAKEAGRKLVADLSGDASGLHDFAFAVATDGSGPGGEDLGRKKLQNPQRPRHCPLRERQAGGGAWADEGSPGRGEDSRGQAEIRAVAPAHGEPQSRPARKGQEVTGFGRVEARAGPGVFSSISVDAQGQSC
jgi:thiol-disulfide isomerase/thioredoxin